MPDMQLYEWFLNGGSVITNDFSSVPDIRLKAKAKLKKDLDGTTTGFT